jgi:hypothetical protein
LGAAQHQSAAAHIATADELAREKQTFAEDFEQRMCVFRRSYAAQ